MPFNLSEMNSENLGRKMLREFNDKQRTVAYKPALSSTSIVIPAVEGLPERKLRIVDASNKDKALLFRLIVAAANYAFMDEYAPLYSKRLINGASYLFLEWLNICEISNRYMILKDYESYMFDKRQNHGGYSELTPLKNLFYLAYQNDAFVESLTADEARFLAELRNTKISPNLNKKQISLASYFGSLDWLRSDTIGVGPQLYRTLASAKLTISSLKCTASSLVTYIYKAKVALRLFLKQSAMNTDDFVFPEFETWSGSKKKVAIGQSIYKILCEFHKQEEKSIALVNAIELLLLCNVTSSSNFDKVKLALQSEGHLKEIFCTKQRHNGRFSNWFAEKTFKRHLNGDLFSFAFMGKLQDESAPMPVTYLETWMFGWLMASLSVQPSDIFKLTSNSFRLLKVGGRVTHIECEYFKGRSNAIHKTRSLSTRKLEGRALLILLNQNVTSFGLSLDESRPVISSTLDGRCGLLQSVLKLPSILEHMVTSHRQNGRLPLIIPSTLIALISNGKHSGNIVPNPKDYTIQERQALVLESETPCSVNLFGLQAIKNSSVHAFSDPYTLHYLINYNSHTNETEKLHYLGPDNEDFLNSAGRITRSVMLDLINNVFDLDFEVLSETKQKDAKKAFNHELESVIDTISYRCGDMLARLKVVTEKSRGVINEVGILSLPQKDDSVFEPIYVLDSNVTAFKIFNYLHEFKKCYRKLLAHNADYLFKTVFPNIEWMERVLEKLSKKSVSEGELLFEKMLASGVSVSVFHSI